MDETIRRSFCIAFQIGRRRRETVLVKEFMIVRVTSVDKTMLPESTEFVSVSVTASIENVVVAFARFLIPRPACADALIDIESMLSSVPVPGAAQRSKIFFRVPSSRQRQKQLYTVWCGPNLAGRSLQRAPLRASHRMPLRCARISFCGRPVCEIGISNFII